jgi:3-(3-hydroxy-phenyl)propionate hydroxylase
MPHPSSDACETASPAAASSIDTDVLIVGLGPVGAALANLLGRYGVRVLAVDKATEIFTKPRAIALDNEALRILQLVGVRDGEFATVALPQVEYRSPLFGRFARINSAGIVDGHPMIVTFYQPELEQLLRSKLAQYPSVEVRLGLALEGLVDDGRQVQACLKGRDEAPLQVRARYLVGADGANSLVRSLLGLEFEGRTFAQDWLIVDALDVPNPIDHCEFICDPRRPTPRMVAPGGRQRWEFMLKPGERPEEMERPESVRRLLAPWCNVDHIRIERTAVYRFQAREARSFSKGRCFLVGDAAHVTPPFAGQGLVAGLRDVANLAWKLAWVLRGDADESILDSYDTERRPHARKIINLAWEPRRRVRGARPDVRDSPGAGRTPAVRGPEGEAGEHVRQRLVLAEHARRTAARGLDPAAGLGARGQRQRTHAQRRCVGAALGTDRHRRRPRRKRPTRSAGALAARGRQGLAVVPPLTGAASRRARAAAGSAR